MKLKPAIRFFEKHDLASCDNHLFGLFVAWQETIKPTLEMEKTAYQQINVMRQFLKEYWQMVERGQHSQVVALCFAHHSFADWQQFLKRMRNDTIPIYQSKWQEGKALKKWCKDFNKFCRDIDKE